MISFLEGILVSVSLDSLVLDVGGVGWQLFASRNTLEKLPAVGEKVRIQTYLHVRDNLLVLYGFHNAEERELFMQLISVTGIGPKVAINILSALPVQTLKGAIFNGDLALLTKIPGIGKKTAQRITLELQGKLAQLESQFAPSEAPSADALEALLNLGYNRSEAFKAIEQIAATGEQETSQIVKKALQLLSGGRR